MGLLAIIAFYTASIKSHHLAGVGFSILFLILINPPALWILKRIKSRVVYRYFSLLINLLEIIAYTGIIYSLGGIEATYLTPIYAALITYVGTVSPRSFPFIVAALCALAFSSMVTLEYLGYLPHQRVVYDFRPPLATQMIYVSVVIGLLFVTAYISAYTAATLKRTRNKLHRKNIQLQTSVRTMSREITERKQAEEALRESEEKYRNLVEESFDGIFIQKGPNIIFANKRLNEMLGYREGELIGQNHWVVYHPDYQKLTRERAQARMRGDKVVPRYEVKLQRKDGSWFYGEINARPITFHSDQESG
ncbi:MAG: PAS domain S-box protein, partial [Proteobacteria bacterium]|nr:PAS domain S-box protein [Pseudomonadota bacterium]